MRYYNSTQSLKNVININNLIIESISIKGYQWGILCNLIQDIIKQEILVYKNNSINEIYKNIVTKIELPEDIYTELHFLFNSDRKNQLIADHSINVNGDVKRNPTLKSREKGHQFMPRLTKQIGAKQLIIPCDYRGFICFAKVDV